ncbi:hypothetical protein P8X24_04455 [Pyrococcus kukulkanii]|uniref:hypothetical protein n=1 Tax=Pyrococcus kukulkanii TaxID=1609559 RepID=UPI003568E655
MELISLLGIVGIGYAFKSPLRLKLVSGGFILAFSLPIVTLTLGKIWYWITILMTIPSYYLRSLVRLSMNTLKVFVISGLMFAPFVVFSSLSFYAWVLTGLYWLILGLVGSHLNSSWPDVLVPPLVVYFFTLIIAITPTTSETQLLKAAALIVLTPLYPIAAWISKDLSGKKIRAEN